MMNEPQCITCLSVGIYTGQLTRGQFYPLAAIGNASGSYRIRDDRGRLRSYPTELFARGRQSVPTIRSIEFDPPEVEQSTCLVEAVITLEDGQRRFCWLATPVTARQVETAMLNMANGLSSGSGHRQTIGLDGGGRIRVEVHESGYGSATPRAHGASAQMSKTIRERIVPNGGVSEGGNPRWGREHLNGTGIRLDFENLAGTNVQGND